MQKRFGSPAEDVGPEPDSSGNPAGSHLQAAGYAFGLWKDHPVTGWGWSQGRDGRQGGQQGEKPGRKHFG